MAFAGRIARQRAYCEGYRGIRRVKGMRLRRRFATLDPPDPAGSPKRSGQAVIDTGRFGHVGKDRLGGGLGIGGLPDGAADDDVICAFRDGLCRGCNAFLVAALCALRAHAGRDDKLAARFR